MRSWIVLSVIASVACAQQPVAYTPLSQEAAGQSRAARWTDTPAQEVHLDLGGLTLEATVPTRSTAYDILPIRYHLVGATSDELVAVEATAFEESARRRGRALRDLALPGRMQVDLEYLGSQTGVFDPARVTRLSATSRHEIFPPYKLHPFVRSATVVRGTNLWFKFRITNRGDTILDPEGFGAWMSRLLAYRENPDGTRELAGTQINDVNRHLEYLYPGESVEVWCDIFGRGQPLSHARTLLPGRYILCFDVLYRWYREYNWIVNMWQGRPWLRLEVTLDVTDATPSPDKSEITTRLVPLESPDDDRMPRLFSRFEEFMTTFDIHRSGDLATPVDQTLHLQVAPWTRTIVLKLLTNHPDRTAAIEIPLDVSHESLIVRHNPDNPFAFVRPDGKREAWIVTQAMPAMRSTSQLGPHPEIHLRERLREMRALGINAICSTGGNWHIAEVADPDAFVGDIHAETFKYYYDVLVGQERMPVFGWGVFPPKTVNTRKIAQVYWGSTFNIPLISFPVTYSHHPELDVGHPDFPRAYAGAILFNHRRWGQHWVRTADGELLIDVEDTWGWLRDDIHIRYFLGPRCLARFRTWCRQRYGSIEAANRVWGTSYTSFEDVDPQAGQPDGGEVDGVPLQHVAPEYTNPDHPFHDWSPAVADWDRFRTELRCDIYDEIQRIVGEQLPGARINLRTEGACILAPVGPNEPNPHLRHVYYSQQRNALSMDVLRERKTFRYHSDYTTLPYTETELRRLLRDMREAGIRGNYLPQFDHMRDMLLNPAYGRPWQTHYNLDQPTRALHVHCLVAAFPWMRVTYEEGHCPGLMWEDYACDGFATETQKKEVRLFRQAVDAAAGIAPEP